MLRLQSKSFGAGYDHRRLASRSPRLRWPELRGLDEEDDGDDDDEEEEGGESKQK